VQKTVGGATKRPAMIGKLKGMKPHILNGLKTILPTSLVEEFLILIDLMISCFSFSVI